MAETVVKVENLYKKFARSLKRSMYYGTLDISRSMLGIKYPTDALRTGEFWALNDINFELKKGETLGIIGANGSGKSTLLRLLTGIFPPDVGTVQAKGSIGALIAVGAGFHPHMSGRENIYLNGTILGMTKKEIDSKFNDIVEFSEIGNFLDAPVSTYSSGMRVRLGFSIAVHREPDILMVDEILSVGDLSFRNKSMRKMAEYRNKANALIYISHNLEQVRTLCNRVIVLEHGEIIFDGDTKEGVRVYEESSRAIRLIHYKKQKFQGYEGESEKRLNVTELGILDENNKKVNSIDLMSPIHYYCDFIVNEEIVDVYFSVGILNEKLQPCIWVMSNDKIIFNILKPGKYRLKVTIIEHHLVPGVYFPNISIRSSRTGETFERVLPNNSFTIMTADKITERGIINVKESWLLERRY